MEFSRGQRLGALLVLLLCLAGLLVVGGIEQPPAPALGDYPGTEEIVQEPDRYLEQPVNVGGRVVATDPVVIQSEYDTPTGVASTRLTITDVDETVTRGDRVQVFGVLTGPETVRAQTVVVVPRAGQWYAWVISFLAGLWVLGRLVRHWAFDVERGVFRPRTARRRLAFWRDE